MDGLISDYSSIAVDYMLLDRPLGYVLTDLESYRNTRGFVFENPEAYMPGEKIYNLEDLKDYFSHIAVGEDPLKKREEDYCLQCTLCQRSQVTARHLQSI